MKNGNGLLVALGIDNAGSGLFLPLSLVYATRVVGLPLATAGPLVAVGSLAGLVVPAVAGGVVDRLGAKPMVITSQLLQAAGAAVSARAFGSGRGYRGDLAGSRPADVLQLDCRLLP